MRRGILNVIWEDKSVWVLRGAAVTVEVRKECACLDTWVAARRGTSLG